MVKTKKDLVSVVIVTRNRNEDLRVCLDSIFKQTYRPLEVVVVDNGSEKHVKKVFQRRYSKVKFVRSEVNLGGAGGRNLGLLNAKASMILFLDDDTQADKNMISELVRVMKKGKNVGIVQPKIYEMERKNVIQGVGHGINLSNGRVYGIGVHVEDNGQFEDVMEIPMAGCTWMVRREVFEKIGDYDEEIFIPYEDSDFSYRTGKSGYKVLYVPKAKIWHRGAKKTFVHPWLEWIGITTPERSFRVARNKIIFMKKHASSDTFLTFLFFYLPMYSVLHTVIIIRSGRWDILSNYWRGIFSGIDYSLISAKHVFLSWIDPVSWVIDKSAKSILDVACGRGMPMRVIKKRVSFKKSVGVDLFVPYINECKRKNIHDEHLICDVRNLPFKRKSFDVVIALQVLEHLKKTEALKVLNRLEEIAKKQVIVSTPVGLTFHPSVDDNELQLHQSGFSVKDFEERGYKVIKMGMKEIQGDEGLVNRFNSDSWKKLVYSLALFINLGLYLFQPLANYYMVAYKKIK